MTRHKLHVFLAVTVLGLTAFPVATGNQGYARAQENTWTEEARMDIEYLEIVTPEVDATCAALAAQHGVTFSAPVAELGNARLAELVGGGRIGVRAPLREDEAPVVRPYMQVADIEAASAEAEAAGAVFAMRATEIPGQGTFAIYILGGVEHGLWER